MNTYNSSHDISREDANIEVRKFLEIRDEIVNSGVANQLSESARNYLNSQNLSFVFYKDQLQNIFTRVTANAARIYFAADNYGKPTLIIIPCELSGDESSAQNKQATAGGPILQYPRGLPSGYNKSDFDIVKE